ncbi:MAG: hypothetical protein H5U29_13560, partial [Pusillimonas sp.]|nr:hypothetical protein [Pusillimonas sp.]
GITDAVVAPASTVFLQSFALENLISPEDLESDLGDLLFAQTSEALATPPSLRTLKAIWDTQALQNSPSSPVAIAKTESPDSPFTRPCTNKLQHPEGNSELRKPGEKCPGINFALASNFFHRHTKAIDKIEVLIDHCNASGEARVNTKDVAHND